MLASPAIVHLQSRPGVAADEPAPTRGGSRPARAATAVQRTAAGWGLPRADTPRYQSPVPRLHCPASEGSRRLSSPLMASAHKAGRFEPVSRGYAPRLDAAKRRLGSPGRKRGKSAVVLCRFVQVGRVEYITQNAAP
jgi:hypothetical protein